MWWTEASNYTVENLGACGETSPTERQVCALANQHHKKGPAKVGQVQLHTGKPVQNQGTHKLHPPEDWIF